MAPFDEIARRIIQDGVVQDVATEYGFCVANLVVQSEDIRIEQWPILVVVQLSCGRKSWRKGSARLLAAKRGPDDGLSVRLRDCDTIDATKDAFPFALRILLTESSSEWPEFLLETCRHSRRRFRDPSSPAADRSGRSAVVPNTQPP